jgi:hypothetical protein
MSPDRTGSETQSRNAEFPWWLFRCVAEAQEGVSRRVAPCQSVSLLSDGERTGTAASSFGITPSPILLIHPPITPIGQIVGQRNDLISKLLQPL